MASEPYHKRTPFRAVAVVTAWVLIFIKPEMIFFACFYSSMKLLPYLFGIDVVVIIAIWIALSCIYAYTYVGNPSGTLHVGVHVGVGAREHRSLSLHPPNPYTHTHTHFQVRDVVSGLHSRDLYKITYSTLSLNRTSLSLSLLI
jgi:hypothetical protein